MSKKLNFNFLFKHFRLNPENLIRLSPEREVWLRLVECVHDQRRELTHRKFRENSNL